MKKYIGLTIAYVCVSVLFTGNTMAQQVAPRPVAEIFTCNFVGNNDMDDLMDVTRRWNQWMDRNDQNTYSAVLLTPFLFSDQMAADVLWFGYSPNGAAMGATAAHWLAEGAEEQAAFDEVIDCNSHAQMVIYITNQPAQNQPPPEAGGLISFSDCTVNETRTAADALGAMSQMSSFLAENGADQFGAAFFPVAGARQDAGFSFKRITGFQSAEQFGQMIDVYTSRGGPERNGELFDNLLECDSQRLYVTTPVRNAQPPQ